MPHRPDKEHCLICALHLAFDHSIAKAPRSMEEVADELAQFVVECFKAPRDAEVYVALMKLFGEAFTVHAEDAANQFFHKATHLPHLTKQ